MYEVGLFVAGLFVGIFLTVVCHVVRFPGGKEPPHA